ncbi:MAG: hypothetical protein ACP5I4_02965 [Oceanipulchritudo sp.]
MSHSGRAAEKLFREEWTDSGDGDGYMRGEYLILCLQWDDACKRLLASTEGGGYPGMPEAISLSLICEGRDPVVVSVPLGATCHELSWSVASDRLTPISRKSGKV